MRYLKSNAGSFVLPVIKPRQPSYSSAYLAAKGTSILAWGGLTVLGQKPANEEDQTYKRSLTGPSYVIVTHCRAGWAPRSKAWG